MNYGLSEDQESVLTGLDQLIQTLQLTAPVEPVFFATSPELEEALDSSGFLDIAGVEGFGPLEAALVTERVARLPRVAEVGASALILPALGLERESGAVAVAKGDPLAPCRFLPLATRLLVDMGDHVLSLRVEPDRVETVDTLFAYPYGRLTSIDGLERQEIADVASFRRRWRIALAAEAAGCMASALETVLEHVKNRQAFGRPLGAFQAIHHRLAMAAETTESARWLALRAAWSDSEADAAIACAFAQSRIAQITYDLHQFSGAMGLTLEFPLHLWTYRLRALSGELGGAASQAREAALLTWGTHHA